MRTFGGVDQRQAPAAARDDDTGEGGKRVRFARILAENSAMHNARRAAACADKSLSMPARRRVTIQS